METTFGKGHTSPTSVEDILLLICAVLARYTVRLQRRVSSVVTKHSTLAMTFRFPTYCPFPPRVSGVSPRLGVQTILQIQFSVHRPPNKRHITHNRHIWKNILVGIYHCLF